MYEMLAKGGPVMIPIGLAALFALAILLERLWALRRERLSPRRFVSAVRDLVSKGQLSEAGVLCKQERALVSVILAAGINAAGRGRIRVKEVMEEAGKSVAAELERYVNALGTIAAISPLMGLLGTVTGMITVFQRVTESGVGDPGLLATGIWEALVTTAAGLTIAIPTYVAYRYLLGRVDRLLLEMEEISLDLADRLGGDNDVVKSGEAE
jgi:biopolymer transport protein ExbB